MTPLSNPVAALKLVVVRQRPFGLPLQLSVLESDDYLRGVQARWGATLWVSKLASKDLNQTLLVSQRFRSQFAILQ